MNKPNKPNKAAAAGAWARFRRSTPGMLGLGFLVALAAAGLAAPWIVPFDALAQVAPPLGPPSWTHWCGTDELGRDIFSRILVGSRLSLFIALGAAALAAAIGTPLGILAGYLGGLTDAVAMRVTDFILALPGILSALVIIVVLGSGAVNLALAIGLSGFPAFTRLARASTLSVRQRGFVKAAQTMGAGPVDIMLRTVAPNVLGPLFVQLAITASVAVLATAALSFLGLGAAPPAPAWGAMLQVSRSYLYQAPLYGVFPGVALALTVASFDAVGRALQDVFGIAGLNRGRLGTVV
ncbi:MAG: ABC transporter permease [Burkholderiales bacterium]|nr:ABC transporter permease [Burkholderiales bacterium]